MPRKFDKKAQQEKTRPPAREQSDQPSVDLRHLSGDQVAYLQSMIGNQAVQRLLKTPGPRRLMRTEFKEGAFFEDTGSESEEEENVPDDYKLTPSAPGQQPAANAPDDYKLTPSAPGQQPAANAPDGYKLTPSAPGQQPAANAPDGYKLTPSAPGQQGANANASGDYKLTPSAPGQQPAANADMVVDGKVYGAAPVLGAHAASAPSAPNAAAAESDSDAEEKTPAMLNMGTYWEHKGKGKDSWKVPLHKRLVSQEKELEVKREFETKEKQSQYKTEASREVEPTKYIMNEDERASYEAKLRKPIKGKSVFWWRGKPLDTSSFKQVRALKGEGRAGRAIFVISQDGSLYLANEGEETEIAEKNSYRFHHTSLVEGKPIIAAGEIWAENGVIKGISDKSGHYMMDAQGDIYTVQALLHFRDNGINVDDVDVELFQRGTVKAWELLEGVDKYGISMLKDRKIAQDVLSSFKTFRPWSSVWDEVKQAKA